ncbi:uncharacterized protein B0T15DRAFT_489284 [Chaetomium strumarium]|uniref:RING-type domain-containing protein n=1 Tax=Chaetomium strumarium TaxID=1170767 RepID=A0AAJ0H344_9PEZI|nr:hypothetical protein B0T15DRAFT_489284 [Chaetomium strumarium]
MELFADHVLRGVHQHVKSQVVPRPELRVRLKGVQQNLRCARMQWCATYDVDLSVDVADTFSLEESWLQKETEACIVCYEGKTLGEMPVKITSHCTHPPKTCRDCLKRWIDVRIDNYGILEYSEKIVCPDCLLPLGERDVRRGASQDAFARYDQRVLQQVLHKTLRYHNNFYYCLVPGCDSGQVHDTNRPEFRCVACSARHCVRHNLPWHEGETCEEYDQRNPQRARDEAASKAEIRSSTKPCPECCIMASADTNGATAAEPLTGGGGRIPSAAITGYRQQQQQQPTRRAVPNGPEVFA